MTFDEVLDQVRELLRQRQRLSYQALKRRFDIDDAYLDDLKAELIEAEQVATDENGRILVWAGENAPASPTTTAPTPAPSPVSYTPQHLAERIRAEQAALEARGGTDGERKTITALFADLKGSTALIEGLDPEEARSIIDPALQLMMDAVHRYEGYVAQALGDGIFALFGAPIAHEDHPQRALYAALRMQDAMRRYGETLRQKGYPPLLMRVGVNTGEVVVRSIRKDDLHTDYVPVGHSTNLAARMEQLATPGSIVVSAYTHRLTDGYFAFKDLGPTQIKGVEEPLHIYEVQGLGQLRTRLQVSASRYGLTRFVGRHSEMEQLTQALAQAKGGQGQIVGTMGEPGLGKSRLFHEFKLLSLGGCLVLEAYSVSHGKATAYLPVIELLKSYFRLESQDDERTRREKVGGKVLMLDRSLEDTLPYLFALLGIEEQPSPLAQMDPQIRRRRTFEALKKLFLRESLNQPLVLIFEDLHWIDGETQGFLDVLSESVASAKILLLTNYRPEYRHEWWQKTYYTQLRLAPLGTAEAEEFLDTLLGTTGGAGLVPTRAERPQGSPLQSLKQLILEKTQGTPFFMEEIVQELVEQGVLVRDAGGAGLVPSHIGRPQGSPLHIPATVQGILAARIDRLAPDEKALLQQLSVIGRQFPVSLIRQVIAQPEAELHRLLASLQHKEFLYEQPAFPESEYIFKHALTQEVAYGTVLQEQRKLLHERIGQAVEALYAATLSEHYSDLAHHYRRSDNAEKAIHYLHLAGQQAVQRSANAEGIDQLTAALELLLTCPETPERVAQELTLRLALGTPLIAIQGWAAPALEPHYTRARTLCDQLGDTPQRFPVLWGLWAFHRDRGEIPMAQTLAEECLQLAEQAHEAGMLCEAHYAVGSTFLLRGELVRARAVLEQSMALYQPQHHALTPLYAGLNPKVLSLDYTALTLWVLGYPEQALTRVYEALHLAQELRHPHSLACALTWTAVLHSERGDGHLIQEHADALVALSSEHGFPSFLGVGTALRGVALLNVQKQWAEGIAQIQQGLVWEGETWRTLYLAWLARGYGGVGQVDDGLATIAEALKLVEKNDERLYEAEVWRVKGELLLVQEGLRPQAEGLREKTEEAETCFQKAIEVAQKQQAKSLELRVVMSLARLWRQLGKKEAARQRLAEIYGWFTEGFDTQDLQEAKTLLAELAEG
ncbi:MAG: AAA family ATPase [Deltaproteobacteria bacterium]|nr:AAA family ATPase [Deltaproteobacteria bacterium]